MAAYEILSDADKRSLYDHEINLRILYKKVQPAREDQANITKRLKKKLVNLCRAGAVMGTIFFIFLTFEHPEWGFFDNIFIAYFGGFVIFIDDIICLSMGFEPNDY